MRSPSPGQLPRATSNRPPIRRWWRYLPFPALLLATFLLIQVGKSVSDFSTAIPAFADPGLETLLAAHGGVINARPLDQPANPLVTILLGLGPTLLLIGGFIWLSRRAAGQMGGGVFGLGKGQAKRYDQATIGEARVTFADAAGIEEAKAELVGMALGVTYQRPEDDRHSYSEQYLHARIVGPMGGRAAEQIEFDVQTTGAENDMQQATDLARQMVTRWGMSERLGPVSLAPREGSSIGTMEGFVPGSGRPYGTAVADAATGLMAIPRVASAPLSLAAAASHAS